MSQHFAFRIDTWDDAGDNPIECLAGRDDFRMAIAAYETAVRNKPDYKDHPAAWDQGGAEELGVGAFEATGTYRQASVGNPRFPGASQRRLSGKRR